jgi:hypothetical protein
MMTRDTLQVPYMFRPGTAMGQPYAVAVLRIWMAQYVYHLYSAVAFAFSVVLNYHPVP